MADNVIQLGSLPDDDTTLFDTPPIREVEEEQFVINKDGQREKVNFRKIIEKIERLCEGLEHVNTNEIIKHVIANFSNGCTTSDLDFQAMKAAMNHPSHHQNYRVLACRLFVDDLHRTTPNKFSLAMKQLHDWGTLADDFYGFVEENSTELDKLIVDSLDLENNFMSLCTWAQIYLLRVDGKIVERPQYAMLREAIGISFPRRHADGCICFKCKPSKKRKSSGDGPVPIYTFTKMTPEVLRKIKKRYYSLAVTRDYVLASPTKFNIGTKCGQLCSCFLAQVKVCQTPSLKLTFSGRQCGWDL